MNNKLLYGKAEGSKAYGIVSIEVQDDIATLFIQDEDGSVRKELVGNKYWILSHQNPGGWHKLNGNQYYQYGKQFTSRKEWQVTRSKLKNSHDIYTIYDPKESFQILKGYSYYRGLKPKDISILSFDIETTSLKRDDTAKILLISNTFRRNNKVYNDVTETWDDNFEIIKKLFSYDEYEDEGKMISAWCDWVREVDPSIITGHNICGYDLIYLQFIADKYDVKLKLGRDESSLRVNTFESKFRKDGSQELHYFKSYIFGREICDTMFLSYRYDIARNFPSYGLKPIIKYLKLEKENRVYYDASQIRKNYQDPVEFTKIKAYCIDDSDDALALFDLMSPAPFYLANSMPKPYQELTQSSTGSPLNAFLVRSYLQDGYSIPKASETEYVKGGLSFGVPGIYKNVLKVDLKSAYPSQILKFKIYDAFKDPEANFYKMVHHFTYERFDLKDKFKETGDKYYYDREQAGKTVINSAYGMLTTKGLNFNNSSLAGRITFETRNMIELNLKWASGKGMEFYNQYLKEEENEGIET